MKRYFELGRKNYEAYCKSTGGVSLISGDKLPEFENLKEEIKNAWQDAAELLTFEAYKEKDEYYINLFGFETSYDNQIKFENNYGFNGYSIFYTIKDKYIIIELEDGENIKLNEAIIFKLDYSLLHRLDSVYNFDNDKDFLDGLFNFTLHLEKQ